MAKGDRLHRISVLLTEESFKLLNKELERRRSVEGARVPPTRVINELILKHLDQERQTTKASHGDRGEVPKVIKTAAREGLAS